MRLFLASHAGFFLRDGVSLPRFEGRAKRNPLKTTAWEAKVFGLYDKFASTDFPVLGS